MADLVCVGLSTLDLVYRVAAAPGSDDKVVATSQELAAGGPAAGAAVTAAALGAAPTLVTSLGRHPLARLAGAELAERGVTVVDSTPDRTEPPAVSSICVVEGSGQRSVVSVNAEGVRTTPPATLDGMVAQAAVVLVDGHLPDLAIAAARAARGHGRLVVLDGGSWKPALADLLRLVDVAACSAPFRVPGCEPGPESALALAGRYGVPAVAVTAGSEPVRWWWTGPGGDQTGAVPVPVVRARDTLGAGDAFHGALAAALAAALGGALGGAERAEVGGAVSRSSAAGLVSAVDFACRLAAVRCASAGARAWLADPRVAALASELPAGDQR